MKLLFNKKTLANKEIIETTEASKKKFFTKKKVISLVAVLLVVAIGGGIYKVKFAKTKTTQSSVKYTTLKKTNIATTISSSRRYKEWRFNQYIFKFRI